MKFPIYLWFALGTALCWGCYGPVLSKSYKAFSDAAGFRQSPFKAYVFIGIAYLVLAIIGGLIMMKVNGDTFEFFGKSTRGTVISFLAGSLGAVGALCLTTAMFKGGMTAPHVVMALVFGGAVTVAAIVSVLTTHTEDGTSPLLWVGIAGMLISAVLVAFNTPHAHPPKPKPVEASTESGTQGDAVSETAGTSDPQPTT